MYSPKIRDDLIPLLYRLARQEGKPMTRLVDEILRVEVERRMSRENPQHLHDPDSGHEQPDRLKKTPDER